MTKEHEPPRAMADLDLSISSKLEVISFDKNNQWFSKTLSQIENIKGLFTLNFGCSFSEKDMKESVEQMNVMHQTIVNQVSEISEVAIDEAVGPILGIQRQPALVILRRQVHVIHRGGSQAHVVAFPFRLPRGIEEHPPLPVMAGRMARSTVDAPKSCFAP